MSVNKLEQARAKFIAEFNHHPVWWHKLVLIEAIRYGAEDRFDMDAMEEIVDELIEAVRRERLEEARAKLGLK